VNRTNRPILKKIDLRKLTVRDREDILVRRPNLRKCYRERRYICRSGHLEHADYFNAPTTHTLYYTIGLFLNGTTETSFSFHYGCVARAIAVVYWRKDYT